MLLIEESDYQLPFEVREKGKDNQPWRFVFSPLDRGYGQTLGNSLRRVLLSSVRGTAVTDVRIEDVRQEFETIDGVEEDVINILMQIKQIAFSMPHTPEAVIEINKTGIGEVTAGDFTLPAGVEIANPDLHICTITKADKNFKMQAVLKEGYGYWPVETRHEEKIDGYLGVDAVFSPIENVTIRVEPTQKDSRADLDRLILTIKTNGTLTPREALTRASQVLIKLYSGIPQEATAVVARETVLEVDPLLELLLSDERFDLDKRIVNALKKQGIITLDNLVNTSRADLVEVPNLGLKSIQAIEEKLVNVGKGYILSISSDT